MAGEQGVGELIIKCVDRMLPVKLSQHVERRKPMRPKFYSKAGLRIGQQFTVNRANDYIKELDFD